MGKILWFYIYRYNHFLIYLFLIKFSSNYLSVNFRCSKLWSFSLVKKKNTCLHDVYTEYMILEMTKTMNQSVRVKILFCGWGIPVTLAALSMLLSSEKQGIPPFRRPSYLLTNRLSSVCFLYFSRFEVVCKRQGIVSMVLQQGIFLIIF